MTARMPSAYGRNRRTDNGGWGAQSAPAMVHWKGAAWPSIQKQQQQQQQVAAAVTPPPTQARAPRARACTSQDRPKFGFPIMWPRSSLHARCDRREKGKGGEGGVWEFAGPGWVGNKKENRKGVWTCLSCLPACLLGNELPPAYIHGLLTIHACMHTDTHTHTHTYIHTLTCVSRIPHGREREKARDDTRAGFPMPSKQTGNIDQPARVFGGCSPPMPILHEPVDTILSQSPGLWESMPQLIGFAGRLGFGAARVGKGRGGFGGGLVGCCGNAVSYRVNCVVFPALSLSLSCVLCVYMYAYVCMYVCLCLRLCGTSFLSVPGCCFAHARTT